MMGYRSIVRYIAKFLNFLLPYVILHTKNSRQFPTITLNKILSAIKKKEFYTFYKILYDITLYKLMN